MKNIQHYYDILMQELNSWLEAIVTGLPNMILAILVITTFVTLALLVKKIIMRMLTHISDSQALVELAGTTAKTIIIVIGIVISLGILGLQKAVFSLMAGAGVIGLALGFAFQDLAANFISGILMAFRKPFRNGDIIETSDFIGTVKKMNMRNTLLQTFDGQLVIIPNKTVFETPLKNYSYLGKRRIQLDVGVAYDTELNHAINVAKDAINSLEFICEDKEVKVICNTFADSSINLSIYYWIEFPNGPVSYLDAINAGITHIKQAFDQAEITIPFPIRTLDFTMTQQQPIKMAE